MVLGLLLTATKTDDPKKKKAQGNSRSAKLLLPVPINVKGHSTASDRIDTK